jgi:hypothetical protein
VTTTLTPSIGATPIWTQAGTGASPGYSAADFRRAASVGLQEGVLAASSFEVTQRAAGVNMSCDIAAATHENGIAAVVQGDAVAGQSLYYIAPHSVVVNEVISAAHATLPRVDRVVVEVLDTTHDASGSNLVRTRVVDGTATAGATLDNLTGAAAVPSSALLLADVLVDAAATTISNSKIRDRRKWARGAYWRTVVTAGNYTISATSFTAVDTTNLRARVECSGVPVRVTARCRMDADANLFGLVSLVPMVDSAVPADAGTSDTELVRSVSAASMAGGGAYSWDLVPAAGSHLIGLAARRAVGNGTLYASAANPLVFTIEEIVRQNTANNATSTG